MFRFLPILPLHKISREICKNIATQNIKFWRVYYVRPDSINLLFLESSCILIIKEVGKICEIIFKNKHFFTVLSFTCIFFNVFFPFNYIPLNPLKWGKERLEKQQINWVWSKKGLWGQWWSSWWSRSTRTYAFMALYRLNVKDVVCLQNPSGILTFKTCPHQVG